MAKMPQMPRMTMPIVVLLVTITFVPLLLITRARSTTFDTPRIHLIPDMDHQFKYNTQAENGIFADARAMRTPPQGTVARGMLREDDHFYRGLVNGQFAEMPPMPITETLLDRGQARYEIFCAPCHGLDGLGQGMVSQRADALEEATWVPPASFHTDLVRGRADGHLFNTINNGIRNMPAYGSQIPAEDRWAIVAYVRALQRSQNARIDDVPQQMRSSMR